MGIVASRLAERFERPAIVISRQGDRAKGSGRSLPGVNLHAIVAPRPAAAHPLGRTPRGGRAWSCRPSSIARFRDDLIARRRGRARRDRAGAGAARWTPWWAGATSALATAEAMEALAPFGRGNPPVRLVVPGAELASPVRVGEGRHLQVRLRSDGVHARAHRLPHGRARRRASTLDERHDAVVALEIERWQGLVSPRVSLEALETLAPRPPLAGQCAQACDVRCPDRLCAGRPAGPDRGRRTSPPAAAAARPARPSGVRDRRGEGAALSALAALAGADRGVVAVVADVPAAPRGPGRGARAGPPRSRGGRAGRRPLRPGGDGGPDRAGPRRAGAR